MKPFKNEHEIEYVVYFQNGFYNCLAINENGAVRVQGITKQEAMSKARSELKKIEWMYMAEEAHLD